MSFLDRVRDLISPPEDHNVHIDAVEEFIEDHHGDDIGSAQDEAAELMERTDELLDQLQDELDALREYEPDKGDIEGAGGGQVPPGGIKRQLQAIEDTLDSFVQSRTRMIDRFEPPDDIKDHAEAVEGLLDEFGDLSQKESMVVQQAGNASRFPAVLGELNDHLDRLRSFLEEEYGVIRDRDRAIELRDRYRGLEEDIERLRSQQDDDRVADIEDEIAEKEQAIEELQESEDWQRRQELRDTIEDAEDRVERLQADLDRTASQLDRGLKKLLYAVENGDVGFSASLGPLRRLRDREYRAIDDPAPSLQAAARTIEEEGLLDSRQLDTFADAAGELEDLGDRLSRIDDAQDTLQDREAELEGMDVMDRLQELRSDLEDLRDRRERLQDERASMEDRIAEKEAELEDTRDELEEVLDGMGRDHVTLVADDQSSASEPAD